MTILDAIQEKTIERLRPAAKMLGWYGIYYNTLIKNWIYPYPELPGYHPAGERGYISLESLINDEYLALSLIIYGVTWSDVKELDGAGEIILHELGLVKK